MLGRVVIDMRNGNAGDFRRSRKIPTRQPDPIALHPLHIRSCLGSSHLRIWISEEIQKSRCRTPQFRPGYALVIPGMGRMRALILTTSAAAPPSFSIRKLDTLVRLQGIQKLEAGKASSTATPNRSAR